MGLIQKQNLTQDFPSPDVSRWESTPQESSVYSNTILLMGVLTFALQLCLALFVVLRCKKLDNKVREALKDPHAQKKVQKAPPSCQIDVDDDESSSAPGEGYFASASTTNRLFGPSIPWDLVQR